MISVEDARARMLAAIAPMPAEWVSLAQARGRVLADGIVARRTHPPFDASAMDGYAVRAADVTALPARLAVIGSAPAGRAFVGSVSKGQAVRIFTGAPLPEGADTIVIQENVDADGDTIVVREGSPQGKHIRRRGYDIAEGQRLIEAGTRLDAAKLALTAAANVPWLAVRRRPRVALLASGDELVRPGEHAGSDQILSSNTTGIAALVEAAGGEAIDLGIAPDRREALAEMIEAARGADILVTLGGASVGDHDLVQGALTAQGFAIDFWKIAMRPGKPVMFGTRNGVAVFGLPGNPVSAFVGALLFLRPALLASQGCKPDLPTGTARLASALPANDRRTDFIRAKLTAGADGIPSASPFAMQDSAMLSILAASDALVIRAPGAPPADTGALVPIVPLDGLL